MAELKYGKLILEEDVNGFTDYPKQIKYREYNGQEVVMPIKLVIQFYDFLKWKHIEKEGGTEKSWEKYCNSFFPNIEEEKE